MIRLLLVIGIIIGAVYLLRWFLTTPAKTVADRIKQSAWLLLGFGLIFLAVTGRLNIIFALIGGAIPWLARHLPNLLRLLGLAKTIKRAQTNKQAPKNTATIMSTQDAYKILGLQASASREEIIATHKRLIQKVHPDKGGSSHLTHEINLAKETLLKEPLNKS